MVCMDHSDASGSSTFFLFLYLFFLTMDYGSIVIFPTFIVYFVSLVLSASPFSSKLVIFAAKWMRLNEYVQRMTSGAPSVEDN